ncbi:MAG TPA: HK97 family phage prohead protease [Gammaproteobacteria bacterium]|nr:HK97 family phage prohead protease [Gammaproteobacteria bacterium]
MAIHLHQRGYNFAKQQIQEGNFNATDSWSWNESEDGDQLLGNDQDWDRYARWHLAWDDEASSETKARYLYPFGKNGQVYASALSAIRSYAARYDHKTVYDAAGRLQDMIDKKTENREAPARTVEVRNAVAGGEVRAQDDGTFEGYIAVWDTVDSYNSTFARGAFAKTIAERGDKIKVFFDHRHLIGHALEVREDSYGVHVRGQIVSGVQAADDALTFMRSGTIDGLSFGFISVKEGRKNGVREIREVKLLEFGPVVFPANEDAEITDVRASRMLEAAGMGGGTSQAGADPGVPSEGSGPGEGDEGRSTDFGETYQGRDLQGKHFRLIDSLEITLFDVWMAWQDGLTTDLAAAVDHAIMDFQASYLEYVDEVIAYVNQGGNRSAPASNALGAAFRDFLAAEQRDLDGLARDTSLTVDELRSLQRGRPIAATAKVAELSDDVAQAHEDQRGEAAEALLREVRQGLPTARVRRLQALLNRADHDGSLGSEDRGETEESRTAASVAEAFRRFRTTLAEETTDAR